MNTFITENFLLTSKYAENLYHNYAENMPIFDFHSHLPVEEISINKNYSSIVITSYSIHYTKLYESVVLGKTKMS